MAITMDNQILRESTISVVSKSQNYNGDDKPNNRAVLSLTMGWDIVWGFVESDFPTFVIPSTMFGVCAALSPGMSDGPQPPLAFVLARIPFIILFNFLNILLFDLSNQRAPESVEEDRINKPWRPIPSGKITSDQARRFALMVAPVALWIYYMLGIWDDGVLLIALCWYYNDLRGSDEFCRDVVVNLCYTMINKVSFRLAIGAANAISTHGYIWTTIISAVALTTMHIQDLKDQEGDRLRGRITTPLFLGDWLARVITAVLVPAWSCMCAFYCASGFIGLLLSLPMGVYLAQRVMMKRTAKDDGRSWKLWCLWHMTLFLLPLFGGSEE